MKQTKKKITGWKEGPRAIPSLRGGLLGASLGTPLTGTHIANSIQFLVVRDVLRTWYIVHLSEFLSSRPWAFSYRHLCTLAPPFRGDCRLCNSHPPSNHLPFWCPLALGVP